jgi:succinate dehydrogenase / fumarate reductase, iron-sulfur subunit
MAAQPRVMTFSISRFNPETDKKPKLVEYTLDVSTLPGEMLLNALEALKEENPEIGFRRSCREGVCGSDGMSINGQNGLACITRLPELPNKVVLRPLPGLPIVRDLIVDMDQFYAQLHKVKPYLQNDEPAIEKERLQSQEDRAKLDGLYECILCACCSTSCPSFWWNPDKFLGPAALLAAYRFVIDSRDTRRSQRLAALKDAYSAFRCRSIMNCVRSCPKKLNPTEAIHHLHQEMLADDENDAEGKTS